MTYFIDNSTPLEHYGVKGMKWGIRKDKEGPSYRTRRQAKKDAKETARAKMFYGEGAGTRRKLINARVNERSKDPMYRQEYEKALATQDMSKHASAAKRERARKDARQRTVRTAKGVINAAVGNTARAGATAIAIYGAMKITGTDQIFMQQGRKLVNDVIQTAKSNQQVNEWIKQAAARKAGM